MHFKGRLKKENLCANVSDVQICIGNQMILSAIWNK